MVGTRPEAIKLAPLAHALAAVGVTPHLVLTGQHPALRAADHGLGGLPCHDLGCPGLDDPMAHAVQVAERLDPHLRRELPDLVIVQGDTSSALGGAQAAHAFGLAIAHVEAGLRSHDRAMPWPEEGNRISIDAVADLMFAPTRGAAANLLHEQVAGEVHVTGNTGIDALQAMLAALGPPAPRRQSVVGAPLDVVVTCHRRENWGPGLAALAMALVQLAAEGSAAIDVVLHPNPRIAEVMHLLFHRQPGIRLSLPSSHGAMIERMRRADLILSDSGGVQEEAPALGVPLLVLRDKTERPEAIASGNARLVGTATNVVLDEVRRLHHDRAALAAMARPALLFGDGRSAPRIAAHIQSWLVERDRPAAADRQRRRLSA
ncbi:MAG: UDP-N-acetylglucosamine 2-epimerase (non-hydrolyzing) [Sphingomicrobium sp.]